MPQPLNADKYLSAPCSSLTQAQQDKLTVRDVGRSETVNGDPSCSWQLGANGDTYVGVTYFLSVKNGLNNLYSLSESDWWEKGYFEPATVEGYPAVYNEVADQRAEGDCVLSAAITDALFFSVIIRARAGNDVCTTAKNVASDVIDTIKKGA